MSPQLLNKDVGSTGYGLMGLTWRPKPVSQSVAFAAMRESLKNGANFWNGGEIYGPPNRNSLHLLSEYFTEYPEDAEKVVLSIKGGMSPSEMRPDGSAKNVRRSIDECLKVLGGKKKLDLFESARVDPNTPIEISIRTMVEYIEAGKLGGISLSECSAESIRRAAKVHKIAAVEVEFSLFSLEILENGVAEACAELDIPIIAYSPLGRGLLTGQIKKYDDIPEDSMVRHMPRFQPDVFDDNFKLVREVEKLANEKGCTVGQIAIAWCKAMGQKKGMPVIIPIPGATTKERVMENSKEANLSEKDMEELDAIIKSITIKGDRYPEFLAALNFGNSPPLEE